MRNPQILVELQEWMGSDESIANAAWTSTFNKARREEKYDDPEKVRDIIQNKLWSENKRWGGVDAHNVPFESVVLRFWIRLPIFIDRQHMTHRMASNNGLSGRYRTMPQDYLDVPQDVQEIFSKVSGGNPAVNLVDTYRASCDLATHNYGVTILAMKKAEKEGKITNAEFKRAREIARGQLPTAGMVERTVIFNLGSFANYQRKRNCEHAQKEIQQIAQMMLEEVKAAGIAPIAMAELEKRGWKL